jgi:hypothetical protein
VRTGSEPCPPPTPLAPDELGGTCLRLLHQLATNTAVQEALAMAQVRHDMAPSPTALSWQQTRSETGDAALHTLHHTLHHSCTVEYVSTGATSQHQQHQQQQHVAAVAAVAAACSSM